MSFHDNAVGVRAAGNTALTLLASTISHNGHVASKADAGIFLTEQASANVVADIDDNAGPGVFSESTGSVQLAGTVQHNGTATGCANDYLCSGVVLVAAAHLSAQSQIANNAAYGVVSNGRHATVELNGATLSGNALANAAFVDTDTATGFTSVKISNTTISNSASGIVWGDRVQVTVSGGSVSGHSVADLSNTMTMPGWNSALTNVRFGPTLAYYPPKPGTLIVSSASNLSSIGPNWSIANPAASGGPGTITFLHQ
jgi:hypothetical protein